MNRLFFDIRYALRQLPKSPGLAVTAMLTLALGIGAHTAIFTRVHDLLLRSLAGAVIVLCLCAAPAGYIPARRAASIDPMKAPRIV